MRARHEWWRHEYRGRRYLEYMSDEELFERLYEPHVSTKAKGGGLGLAIVDRIVEVPEVVPVEKIVEKIVEIEKIK